MKWLDVLLDRPEGPATRKAIDAAAVKAEALVLVGEIRDNLDRIEGIVRGLPDPPGPVDETRGS